MKLDDILQDDAKRAAFVEQGTKVIDEEVASKGGFSGMALKAAFGTVKKLKPGIVGDLLEMLLPHFAPAVAPYFQSAQQTGDVAGYFRDHSAEIAEAMLKVTDARAERAQNPVLKRTYSSLRGQALQHTTAAMPRVGELLASFVN